ncbi:hypothetical protein B9Z55_020190 [Caenorhabditis nigoni]|uniref:CHK kinase-like domain-containing protein n=1 Tax=Caenorhabditis nigoni TaxID=1611254 RepID=A0A2G5TM47_9PELO|nr:hypothetical protein B9Z55_020190 [Caenorhabditis nigoni]
MSLYEPADGILETHVTWEDVESDLQKKLGTKATFGPNKKAVNISDLKGFMSRIALVEPDWQNVENGKELPQKFALKISSQLALVALSKLMNFEDGQGFGEEKLKKMSALTKEFHNREVDAYKILMKFDHPDIPYTKVYSLKSFDDENDLKGYMAIEFISNIHQIEMFRSIPADDLFPLVRGIATFAVLSESLSPEETKYMMGQDYLEMLFKEFFNDAELARKFEGLRKLANKEEGKLTLEAMIDWQVVCRMPPGLDLSRLMLQCLSETDRRERGTEILKCYYDTFTSVYGEELFSLHELQESYNLYAPMMAMLLIPDIYSIIDSAKLSEEEKEVVRKDVMRKIIDMMEDIIDIHDYNLEHYSDFLKVE